MGVDYEVKESRTYMVEEGEINGRRQKKKIANKKGLKRKKKIRGRKRRHKKKKEGTNGITV